MSTKKINLKDWITGYTLGLAGKPLPISATKKELIGYLYGHTRLAVTPPKYDEMTYKYAAMLQSDAYIGTYYLASTMPFYVSDGKLVNDAVDGGVFYKLNSNKDGWIVNTNTVNEALETAEIAPGTLNALVWANPSVLNADNSVYLEGSKPRALYAGDVLETLYDGEVTTVASDDSEACVSEGVTASSKLWGSIRVRISGCAINADVTASFDFTLRTAGNKYLANKESEDTGEDWCLLRNTLTAKKFVLYTKEPGTYSVKIESLATE